MSLGQPDREPVVVTGRGVLTPLGLGLKPLLDGLRDGQSAISDTKLEPLEGARPVALLDESAEQWTDAWFATGTPLAKRAQKLVKRGPRGLVGAVVTAAQAWSEAALDTDRVDGERRGVVVGGHDLAMGYEENLRTKFGGSPHHLPPSFAVRMMDTDHVGVLSELLGIRGYGLTVGGASASGTMALIQAHDLIRAGRIDQCLVVGPMAELSPMALQSFDAMGALGGVANPGTRASRPFDQARDGFVFGQAVATLVLERASEAQLRQARVRGRILGTGVALDASASPAPSAEGEARAMRYALDEAGVAPGRVDTINAHGTSSRAGDGVELEAIAEVFGEHAKTLRIQSSKGFLGHTLWAAGVLEALVVLGQMEADFVHGNANLTEPIDDAIGLVGSTAVTPGPRIALSNSFGFGGINTSVVLGHAEERGTP